MLRESSVPYSSLPQEEGEQSYITTRTSGPSEPSATIKSRIAPVLVILLLICGVPLMIIAPLAITRARDRVETYVTSSHLSDHAKVDGLKSNETLLISSLPIPTPQVTIAVPVIKNTTPKPLVPAPPPTTTTTTSTTTTTTTTTTTARPVDIVPTASVSKSPVEAIEESGENQTVAETGTTDMPESQEYPEGGSGSGEDIADIPYTTSHTFSGMMSNLMSKHEWWTLAILAVVAALALAAVVSAFTWIIYNRIASRRRRTNLEKVITDLQSKDKVVLLNSEDSEDEA